MKKITIGVIGALLCLSLFSVFLPKARALLPRKSSVSDPTNDFGPTGYPQDPNRLPYKGYVDLIYAEVRVINLNTLVFEMTMVSRIPLNPIEARICYCWQVDTDLDPNTGEWSSEYNLRVENDNDGNGWYGTIDINPSTAPISGYGGGPCPVTIKGNTILAIMHLSQIGNAPYFRWWPQTQCTYKSSYDDQYYQMNDWKSYERAAIFLVQKL